MFRTKNNFCTKTELKNAIRNAIVLTSNAIRNELLEQCNNQPNGMVDPADINEICDKKCEVYDDGEAR